MFNCEKLILMKRFSYLALLAAIAISFSCTKYVYIPVKGPADSSSQKPDPEPQMPAELPVDVIDIAQANSEAAGLSVTETANCYVINQAGKYAFPAEIRGNGKATGNLSPRMTGIASADIVWDSGDILKRVSLYTGTSGKLYVVVETPKNYALGNALVAVKDASGNILWSWHIWSTRYRVGVDDQVLGESPRVFNGCWAHMPLELGMTTTNDRNCMLYQWGRKDPFRMETPSKLVSSQMTLEESIKNPDTFYYSTVDNRSLYCVNGDVSLWNPGNNLAITDKTMLDPCPPGYFVVPYNALKEALNHNVASCTSATVVKLRSGLSIWFHPVIWDGQLTSTSSYHFYWQHSYWNHADDAALKEGQYGSAYVHRDGTKVTKDNTGGVSGGFPVRAVRPGRFKAGFIGDSITQIWGGYSENNSDPDKRGDSPFFISNGFLNKGVGGETTSQILARFDKDIVANHPPKVVILAGTNDLAGNDNNKQPRSIDFILGNLSAMARKAFDGGISEVLICSVLPTSQYSWSTAIEPMPLIQELNAKIKAYCEATPGCTYVDYYSAWLNAEGTGAKDGLTYDNVHPTPLGCALMEQIILPYLQ